MKTFKTYVMFYSQQKYSVLTRVMSYHCTLNCQYCDGSNLRHTKELKEECKEFTAFITKQPPTKQKNGAVWTRRTDEVRSGKPF